MQKVRNAIRESHYVDDSRCFGTYQIYFPLNSRFMSTLYIIYISPTYTPTYFSRESLLEFPVRLWNCARYVQYNDKVRRATVIEQREKDSCNWNLYPLFGERNVPLSRGTFN